MKHNQSVNRTPKKQAFLVPYAALRRRLLQRYVGVPIENLHGIQ